MLRILSYNVHKGFRPGNRALALDGIKSALHTTRADLIFLQEVVGQHDVWKLRHQNWPAKPQHEFFCDHDVVHRSYGKNASYPEGHHGNAILSRHPLGSELNVDVSLFGFAQRGFLHVTLDPAHHPHPLHAICIHFGLFEKERRHQASELCKYVHEKIPKHEALLVVGDTNDWRQNLSQIFRAELGLREVFWESQGQHARTFPSWLPALRLDRIYFRNLELKACEALGGRPWNRLSDHLPLVADFRFPK